jgi:hypothetical protein
LKGLELNSEEANLEALDYWALTSEALNLEALDYWALNSEGLNSEESLEQGWGGIGEGRLKRLGVLRL